MGNCRSSPRPLNCYIAVDAAVLAVIGIITAAVIILELCLCCFCYNTYKNFVPNKLLVHFVKNIKFEEKELEDKLKDWKGCGCCCGSSKAKDKGDKKSDDKDEKQKDKSEDKNKKSEDKSENKKKKSEFIFKYKDEAMVFVVILTLTYAACQFWDSFAINIDQDNCVEGLDCYLFPKDAPSTFVAKNWRMPPLNCSEVEMNTTDPILCYSYAFDIGKGIADAGGILASTTVEIITFFVLVELFKCCCKESLDKESKRRKKKCCTCACFCDWILRSLLGVLTVVFIWLSSAPAVSTTQPNWLYLLTDVPKLINPIVLSLQVLFLTCIPWKCCMEKKNSESDSKDSKSSQPNSDAIPIITHIN